MVRSGVSSTVTAGRLDFGIVDIRRASFVTAFLPGFVSSDAMGVAFVG